jgi:hypothetical protein
VIDRTYAVVGFGEASLPEIDISPPDCAAGYTLGAAQSGGEKRAMEGYKPSKPPAWRVTA